MLSWRRGGARALSALHCSSAVAWLTATATGDLGLDDNRRARERMIRPFAGDDLLQLFSF